jgi:pyridoxine 5-phosphate synthase
LPVIALSININKIATLRNARGANLPDVCKAAIDIERFGADGITVHPRPDERHIRYTECVKGEFNIEGNPQHPAFIKLVMAVQPHQVTLVPDTTDQLTSNQGWNPIVHAEFLKSHIAAFKAAGIRTSLFLDPKPEWVAAAAATGTDRIELYTEMYAEQSNKNSFLALQPYLETAQLALHHGLGINAGHDLNLENLPALAKHLPGLAEVSIGHAFIADALYFGLQNTLGLYRRALLKN